VVVSGVLAGLDERDDHAVVVLSGALRQGTQTDVRRLLLKLLADHGRLLVDLSRMRLEWLPAVQVFPAVLTEAGGWPTGLLVLFGADERMAAGLGKLHVGRTVPVVATLANAERRLFERPARVVRDRELPADLAAPGVARAFLRDTCTDWEVPALADDAALVVTELVSNAVQHAGSESRLRIGWDDRGLWIEVRDYRPGDDARPRPRVLGAHHGRGLHVVAAVATHWGVSDHLDGKTVWALVSVPPAPRQIHPSNRRRRDGTALP
jgi:anti-sigma regulatory factor (Ser/Thr protein kinase)